MCKDVTLCVVLEIKFSKGLRNITVAEGAEAILQVEVANTDINAVRWEMNGILVREDGKKIHATHSDKTFSLRIHNVSKKDEAAYSCIVGSAKTIARLYVEGLFIWFV